MIEENSDEDSVNDEGKKDTSDTVSDSNPESLLESLEPFPEDALGASSEVEEEPVPAAQKRREKRRRQRMIEDLAETYGLGDKDAIQTMLLIDELLPERGRMSTAKHVGQRLERAMKDLKDRHPRLLFTREGKGLDITDPTRYFYPTGAFAKLLDDEEGILRAIIVNRRARAGAERMAREHDAVEELLLTEYVRRSTLVEQWRYLLPKYMLPFFSMMEAAGVKADQARVDTALFNRVRDVIIEWSGGIVTREEMMAAARRTEEEFLHALKDDEGDSGEGNRPLEDFDGCRERLRLALVEARTDLEKLDGLDVEDDDISAAGMRGDRLVTAINIDAGMDAAGRLVFPSVDTFMDAITARRRAHRGIVAEDVGEGDEARVAAGEGGVTPVANEPVEGLVDDGTGDDTTPVRQPEGGTDPDQGSDVSADLTGDVGTQSDSLDGPSAEDFGPDIPEDLFGPQVPGQDNDEEAERLPGNPSDADDHHFAEADLAVDVPDMARDRSDNESEDELAPVGNGPLAFDPADLESWPSDNLGVRRTSSGLARATGLSRSTFDKPFSMWRPSMERPPFCFMGFRLQPDLSAREGREGPIEPVDLSRLEIGNGQWKAATIPGPSPILGPSHPLMLPPHSRLSWYGKTLDWSETDIRSLSGFGSPAKPETVAPKGDGGKLADAMRGVARLRLAELAQRVPEHLLADEKHGAERRAEAVEDLARYWIFVLLARHDQAGFDRMFTDGFFQGVHGPDFVVDAAGNADFGAIDKGGHIGIFSAELMRDLPPPVPDKPFLGAIGTGVVSGMRRPGI